MPDREGRLACHSGEGKDIGGIVSVTREAIFLGKYFRLSVRPVTAAEWQAVAAMAGL